MHLKLNSYNKYWIGIWFLVLIYLILGDTIFAQEISHTKNFSSNQFGISYVFPLGRTEVTRNSQIVLDEPVYITAYAPLRYSKAEIKLSFSEIPKNWSIGVQTGPGFSYVLTPLEGIKEQQIILDVSNAFYNKNRLRFILSNDGENVEPFEIESLSVIFTDTEGNYLSIIKRNLADIYENLATIF